MSDSVETLSTSRLAELEETIERGLETFVEVGSALLEIRDSRLYREVHSSFENYCQKRWGFNRVRAHQLIEASETFKILNSQNLPPPKNDAQVRELAPLARQDPDAAREVWADIVDLNPNPTAKDIKEAVDTRLGIHFSSETPEWHTPAEVIHGTLALFGGTIHLDPCSNSKSNPNVPAALHFTAEDDGLAQEWSGSVYMNPPYGRGIGDWVEKLVDEHGGGRVEEAKVGDAKSLAASDLRRMYAEAKILGDGGSN